MQLSLCVPVVFNQKLVQKTRHELPKREITCFPMPWCLFAFRILLVFALLVITSFSFVLHLATVPPEALSIVPSVMFFFYVFACILDITYLLVFEQTHHSQIENSQDHINISREYKIFMTLRSACALAVAVCFFMISSMYIYYAAVALISISIEWILWKLRNSHYFFQTSNYAKLLIEDVQKIVGLDNCVSKPIINDFQYCNISEEKLWEGVPIASRDTTIQPYGGFMKNQKEETPWIFFVLWKRYAAISKRIKDDSAIIDDLVKRNQELRDELLVQNERIVHMRIRFDGPNPDCPDINEVPLCPHRVDPWSADKADGLFVSSGGESNVLVKLADFRQLALNAALVRKSIRSLELERRQLKEGLQKRKPFMDRLFVKMFNDAKEESRKSDVRLSQRRRSN